MVVLHSWLLFMPGASAWRPGDYPSEQQCPDGGTGLPGRVRQVGRLRCRKASHKVAARIVAGHCGQRTGMTGPDPREMGRAMMKEGTPDNSNF
jgi:hypothetical protein